MQQQSTKINTEEQQPRPHTHRMTLASFFEQSHLTLPNTSTACMMTKQSMKMIASTKLNKAQRAMAAAKAYGAANTGEFPI